MRRVLFFLGVALAVPALLCWVLYGREAVPQGMLFAGLAGVILLVLVSDST